MPQPASTSSFGGVQITWLDNPSRAMMFNIILLVLLLDPLIVLGLLALVGVPWVAIALLLALIVTIPVLAIWLIVRLAWHPFARRHGPQPVREGAVGKRYQSFFVGDLSRFNNCIDIVADDAHLHLFPFPLLRWCGARPASIPWQNLSAVRPGRWRSAMLTATLDGRTIQAPAWCLELARPSAAENQ